ncbi:hypothetical protein [Nocardia carnea]|uniref:hypothetical protein n=1 Tax=Nocardia carnea TaxID=37328 RepID=UPI0024555EF4|nr:hypothetical protein [Nocardia carnea]
MSAELAALVPPATAVAGGWFIFWMQLPRLVTSAATALVAIVALIRARREDIPKVLFASRNSVDRPQYLQARNKLRQVAKRSAAPAVPDTQIARENGQTE